MKENGEAPNIFQAIFDILNVEKENADAIQPDELNRPLMQLRAWQANRLAGTYFDLLAEQQYESACQFFLSDIYGGRDFSQRDHEAEVIYRRLSRLLPKSTLDLVRKTIWLNRMSSALDQKLLYVLVNELGMKDDLSEEMYVQAYRLCDNYAERRGQIELFVDLLHKVGQGAQNPLIGGALRLTRRAAVKAEFAELHSFLVRGYLAFKPVHDVRYLVNIIQEREMRILDQIYNGNPNPLIT